MKRASEPRSVIESYVTKALRLGADAMEVEYKDGHEEVLALKGACDLGIGRLPSSGARASTLRSELHALSRQKGRIRCQQGEVEVRVQVYDSFGEDAFHVEIRRV
jgi:hypothetical protein